MGKRPPLRIVGDNAGQALRLHILSEIQPALTANALVKKLLSCSAMSVVFGAPGSGKSFLVVDALMRIAAGLPWLGLPTRPCGAVYFALEGGYGARNRIVAARRHLDLQPDVPFALVDLPIDLCTENAN
jgi:RecA-family ATPase